MSILVHICTRFCWRLSIVCVGVGVGVGACVRACVCVCVCIHNFNIIVFVLMHSFSVWSEWFPFAVMIKKFWNHCSWLSYVVTEFVLATISFVGWCLMFCQSVIAQFAGGSTPDIGYPPILEFCYPPPPQLHGISVFLSLYPNTLPPFV